MPALTVLVHQPTQKAGEGVIVLKAGHPRPGAQRLKGVVVGGVHVLDVRVGDHDEGQQLKVQQAAGQALGELRGEGVGVGVLCLVGRGLGSYLTPVGSYLTPVGSYLTPVPTQVWAHAGETYLLPAPFTFKMQR